jgi:FkbH-like protein
VTPLEKIRCAVSRLGYNDCLRQLKAVNEACTDGKPLRVALLRSYTVEPIEPILKLRLLLDGFRPSIWIGGYNQYTQEILNERTSLHAFRPDLVVMMIRLEEVMPDFVDEFPSRPSSHWQERVAQKVREIGGLVERIEAAFPAQVIMQSMTLPAGGYFGINDAQRPEGQSALVHTFNQGLAAEFAKRKRAYLWDFDRLVRAKGYENLRDPKMWYVSRNPFRQSAYPTIVDDLMRYIRSALGRIKKCVVVDLDNTLWGGIVGEDGIEGIALGRDYPGNCYRDFQKELLKLYHRGILLAINSKNNESDALEVLDKHPDMVLRRKHFAAYQINWQDKVTNLKALAKDLNIGIDSMVFIDDNPRECELIRQQCPECPVFCVPDKPYLIPRFLESVPGLECLSLTEEDVRRGEMYQAQLVRGQSAARFENLEDFWKDLQLEVRIEPAQPFSIPRIAQLTQRTNQMNMTTRRYTEAQVEALAADRNWRVVSVAAKDRFGDHGIIGVMFLRLDRDSCHIDNFLMSCRVLGLNIEQYMIAYAAAVARQAKSRTLLGEFIPTAKNKVAADMYPRLGFTKMSDTLFGAEPKEAIFKEPEHIKPAVETFLTGGPVLNVPASRSPDTDPASLPLQA